MDFIIGLPPSKWGDKVYNTIYIIVDRYTKIALYLPIVKTITVTKLADLFLNEVVYYFIKEKIYKFGYSNSFYYKQIQGYFSIAVDYYIYYIIYLITLSRLVVVGDYNRLYYRPTA